MSTITELSREAIAARQATKAAADAFFKKS